MYKFIAYDAKGTDGTDIKKMDAIFQYPDGRIFRVRATDKDKIELQATKLAVKIAALDKLKIDDLDLTQMKKLLQVVTEIMSISKDGVINTGAG